MKIIGNRFDESGTALLTDVEYADGRKVTHVTPCVTPEQAAMIDAYLEQL